jgi:hypothetical protein
LKTAVLSLALGIVMVGSAAADPGPHNLKHARFHHPGHSTVGRTAEKPSAANAAARAEASPPLGLRPPAFGDSKTQGLSRDPDDCAKYGCIDTPD